MKRLRRRIFNIVGALSLLLCAGLCCLYFRSQHTADLIYRWYGFANQTQNRIDATSLGGRISFTRVVWVDRGSGYLPFKQNWEYCSWELKPYMVDESMRNWLLTG